MSLLIGLYIKKTLEGSERLAELTEGRIAPVVFPEIDDVPAPYVTFARTGYAEESTKDGIWGETCQAEVECVGRTYEEMLMLCQAVTEAIRSDLRRRGRDFSDMPFVITDCDMNGGAEDFDAMTCEYISRISLAFETQPHESEQPDEPEKENIFLAMGFPFTLCGNGEPTKPAPMFALGLPFDLCGNGETETAEELAAELPMSLYGGEL